MEDEPGDGGDDEPVEVVQHRPGDELAQLSGIALVGAAKGTEVGGALALVDDRRRIAETHEYEIQEEAAGPSVAIQERMHPLEPAVE